MPKRDSTAKRLLHKATRLTRYDRWGPRITSEAYYRRLKARLEKAESESANAAKGIQGLIDELQRILFENPDTTSQSRSAAVLVHANGPIRRAIEILINRSDKEQHRRSFQFAVPFLARPRVFPLRLPADFAPLRIVDVGSQSLESEHDIYAPLQRAAPVEVIGFDPFSAHGAPDSASDVARADGRHIRTFPHLVADGGPVTFHINQYSPTSSIFPANRTLAERFPALGVMLETIEQREMPSRTLDDIMGANGIADRIDFLKIDVQGAAHAVLAHGRTVLRNTLICQVEVEFAPLYSGEPLFADVDAVLREEGFSLVDFHSLGRQRYAVFDKTRARAFHRGRLLWADCIYMRALDVPGALTPDELWRAAFIMHVCYNKQDVAAELLACRDKVMGTNVLAEYLAGAQTPAADVQ